MLEFRITSKERSLTSQRIEIAPVFWNIPAEYSVDPPVDPWEKFRAHKEKRPRCRSV